MLDDANIQYHMVSFLGILFKQLQILQPKFGVVYLHSAVIHFVWFPVSNFDHMLTNTVQRGGSFASWNILPASTKCIDVCLTPGWPLTGCTPDLVLVGCLKSFDYLAQHYPHWILKIAQSAKDKLENVMQKLEKTGNNNCILMHSV